MWTASDDSAGMLKKCSLRKGEPGQGPPSDGRPTALTQARAIHHGCRKASRARTKERKRGRRGVTSPFLSILPWSSAPPHPSLLHSVSLSPKQASRRGHSLTVCASLKESLSFHFHTGHTQLPQTRTQSPLKGQRSQTLQSRVRCPGQRAGRDALG